MRRLSALDASFLHVETPSAHMHVRQRVVTPPVGEAAWQDEVDFDLARHLQATGELAAQGESAELAGEYLSRQLPRSSTSR
jgi:hypothetical protein